jgi:Tfp pilus assembly protein PilO
MILKSTSPSQIHIVGVALSTLILAASVYAVYSSWNSRQSGIESSQLELTQVSTQLSTAQRDRGRLLNQISNLESIVNQQDPALNPTSINELAVQIVELAEKHALNLDQFEPQPIENNALGTFHPISIRLTATYSSVSMWLDQLHILMPDIHVVSITIRSKSAVEPEVTSDIQLNWYNPDNDKPAP